MLGVLFSWESLGSLLFNEPGGCWQRSFQQLTPGPAALGEGGKLKL